MAFVGIYRASSAMHDGGMLYHPLACFCPLWLWWENAVPVERALSPSHRSYKKFHPVLYRLSRYGAQNATYQDKSGDRLINPAVILCRPICDEIHHQ